MQRAYRPFVFLGLSAFLAGSQVSLAQGRPTPANAAQTVTAAEASGAVLTREQAAARMPATVFFRGQTAPIQARNAAGLRIPGGRYLLAAVVDTSGYASSVAESYQAYLLTEVPVHLGSRDLLPGAYGFGFVGEDFVCMDLGGAEVLRVSATRDAALPRPSPLQIVAEPGTAGDFRLYAGRNYVSFTTPASSASR